MLPEWFRRAGDNRLYACAFLANCMVSQSCIVLQFRYLTTWANSILSCALIKVLKTCHITKMEYIRWANGKIPPFQFRSNQSLLPRRCGRPSADTSTTWTNKQLPLLAPVILASTTNTRVNILHQYLLNTNSSSFISLLSNIGLQLQSLSPLQQ